MTKKHFIAIAAAFRDEFDSPEVKRSKVARDTLIRMISVVASVCQDANPQFDKGRFIRACGA